MTLVLLNFLNFFLSQFVLLYQLNILTRYQSAKHLMLKPGKLILTFFSLPNESCSVNRNSVRYRGAKLIDCLLETGFSAVDFSIRIKRRTSKHMQHVIIKYQILNNFQ